MSGDERGDASGEPAPWAPFDASSGTPASPGPAAPSTPPSTPPLYQPPAHLPPSHVPPSHVPPSHLPPPHLPPGLVPAPMPNWGPPVDQQNYLQRPGAAETRARNRRALVYALIALVVTVALFVLFFAAIMRNGGSPDDFGGF